MKKKDIVLIVGAVFLVLVAFLATRETYSIPQVELPLALSSDEVGLINVSYDEYEAKIENGENFIIVIERTGCSYCEMYMPVLEDATSELQIPVYYIDTADLTEEEYNALGESNTYLKREKWGTPTTLLMSGNMVADSIGGYVEKDEFVDFIEKNIILSQDDNTDVE